MWLDRINIKERLSQWLTSNSLLYVVSVNDSQELEDIRKWISVNCNGHCVARIHYNSDVEILCHEFLHEMTEELGDEHFENFLQLYGQLGSSEPPVNITLNVGNQSKSKGDMSYENIQQTASIDKSYERLYFLDQQKNLSELLKEFLEEIQVVTSKKSVLFVLSFGKKGLGATGSQFQQWLRYKFYEKMSTIPNLKICIISKNDLGVFENPNGQFKETLKNLCHEDITEVAKEYVEEFQGFVYGIVDEDNTLQYKMLKLKIDTLPENIKTKKAGL